MAARQHYDTDASTGNDRDSNDDVVVSFDVVPKEHADPQFDVQIWTSSDGYTRLNDLFNEGERPEDAADPEKGPSYLHRINASLDDPQGAFGEDSEVHHKSHIQIDAPEYVETLAPEDHISLHVSGAFRYDQRGIPVRAPDGEVTDDERAHIEPPGAGDLSRWALPRREDVDDESGDTAAESDERAEDVTTAE